MVCTVVVGAEPVVTPLVVVGAMVVLGVATEVVGAAFVVVGACVVVGCAMELLGGAKLVLWAIVVVETGGCIVDVGAAAVLVEGGGREVAGQSVVMGTLVDDMGNTVVVGKADVVMGA